MSAPPLYEEAIRFLFGRIDYERAVSVSYRKNSFKLGRMRALLERLGNPHHRLPAVHVAGTKGKGSTSAFVACVLEAAGYRTGLFSSPHLYRVEERLTVDGQAASSDDVVLLVQLIRPHVEAMDRRVRPGVPGPTYFEITTAMAMTHFVRQGVDAAVLEVGMGGRLDSTNVCRPRVSVITSISRDHTKQLGSGLDQIATEKAGIIKPGVPVVSGAVEPAARQAIGEICAARGAPLRELGQDFDFVYEPPEPVVPGTSREGSLVFAAPEPLVGRVNARTWRRHWPDLQIPLLGLHQGANGAVALAALETLCDQGWEIPPSAVYGGMRAVQVPARVEVVACQPTVVVDAAHNWASVKALVETLRTCFRPRRRLLLFATTQEKDHRGMLWQLLPFFDAVVLTRYLNNPRGVPPGDLARLAGELCDAPVFVAATPAEAWQTVKQLATPADLICVTGSFFIAAEIRQLVLDEMSAGACVPPPVPALAADDLAVPPVLEPAPAAAATLP